MDPKRSADDLPSDEKKPNADSSEMEGGTSATRREKTFLAVLGNVGSGKTTVTNLLRERYGIPTEPEPVEEWKNLGILRSFYADIPPSGGGENRMAYKFQSMVLTTRLSSYSGLDWENNDCYAVDGHVLSDKLVFADKLYADGLMDDDEKRWYDRSYEKLTEMVPRWEPNVIAYLNTDPETCMRRIEERDREEETGIGIDYLESMHGRYESMMKLPNISDKVLEIDGNDTPDEIARKIHQHIRNRVEI